MLHLHELQHLPRLAAPLGLGDAAHLEAEGDVVEAVEMRKERVALEHHGGAALGRRQVADGLVAEHDVAARRRLVAGDHAQRRGLAAARGAEQAAIGSRPDLQIDRVHRDSVAIALGEAGEFDVHEAPLSAMRGAAISGPRGRRRAASGRVATNASLLCARPDRERRVPAFAPFMGRHLLDRPRRDHERIANAARGSYALEPLQLADQALMNASRSALTSSLRVVHMPCGAPL